MTGHCFCNSFGNYRCCVACEERHPGSGGCYPCNTSRNTARCLQTGETKLERIRSTSHQ